MARAKKNSRADGPAIDRPFDPKILAAAERIAAEYQIVLWREEGRWFGRGLEMPYTFGDGATPDECVASTLEGLVAGVAYLLEKGAQTPAAQRAETVADR